MIIDACLFAGEREMLELRFRTLQSVVGRFVVVACARTHQGQAVDVEAVEAAFIAATDAVEVPARLFWVRPSMILDRGQGVVYERPPEERGPVRTKWFQHIEKQHRNGMRNAVETLGPAPYDVVLMSDVDEIPHPVTVLEAAHHLRQTSSWLVFAQRFHSGALNILHPQQPWWGTCAALWPKVRPQAHRDARTTIGAADQSVVVLDRGGWHFSWFGTDEERQTKLDSFSHAELRGTFDPADGRRSGYHSNGERLQYLTLEECEVLDWPSPLIGGFVAPSVWYQEAPA